MAKLVLTDQTNTYNATSINEQFTRIEAEFQDKVLYRDNPVGESNVMENALDMNSNRILNLPEPLTANEAARLVDVRNGVSGAAANLISFTPSGSIAALNVQAAIQEVDAEKMRIDSLAASTGAALVGNSGETVADSFNALQLVDYAALRASTSPRKSVYITGYLVTAAPSGIAGMFIRDDNDTASLDNSGTIIVRADNKRYKRAESNTTTFQMWGAKGDGTTDDLASYTAFKTWSDALSYPVTLNLEGLTYKMSAQVDINPYRCSIIGAGAILDWSALTAGNCVRMRGTTTETPFYLYTRKFSGFAIKGGANMTLLDVESDAAGSPTPDSAFITFDHVHLTGPTTGTKSDTGIRLYNNSWVINFIGCSTSYCTTHAYVPPSSGGLTNYGERTFFTGHNFFGGGTAYRSEWRVTDTHFVGCSFDQLDRNIHLIDGGQAYINNCHFETPTDTLTLFELTGQSSACVVSNSIIRTDARTLALGNVDSSCVNGGLEISGGTSIDIPSYSANRLITGAGKVVIERLTYDALTSKPQRPFSDFLNQLSNPGFENGTTTEWTLTGGLAPTVSATVALQGTRSVFFDPVVVGDTSLLDLRRPVRAGQSVNLELYYKLAALVSATDPPDYRSFSVRIDIFDQTGATNLYNQEFYFGSVAGTTIDWTRVFTSLNDTKVPKGADYIRIRMGTQGATGEAWVDAISLEIID